VDGTEQYLIECDVQENAQKKLGEPVRQGGSLSRQMLKSLREGAQAHDDQFDVDPQYMTPNINMNVINAIQNDTISLCRWCVDNYRPAIEICTGA
jgi:hypothetical protein